MRGKTVALLGMMTLAGVSTMTNVATASGGYHPHNIRVVVVRSSRDTGPWTLRWAIDTANENESLRRIEFNDGVKLVKLATPVVYGGAQALTIDGAGAVVTGRGASDLLVANGGGDLHLRNVAFTNALGNGVVVNVPAGALAREQSVSLRKVRLEGNGRYGLHFDEQSGGDGAGNDSAASLRLVVRNSRIVNNNNFTIEPILADKDGIRVDEGGDGDIMATIHRSTFVDNAADGIELDERGEGSVIVTVTDSQFDANGAQPQNPDDLEDGFDVDEAGPGDIWVTALKSQFKGNRDEGFDLDGADQGSAYFTLDNVEASDNGDENVQTTLLQNSSAVAGTIVARLNRVVINSSNNGDGIKLENFDNDDEENPVGSLTVWVQNSVVSGNDSDDIQLEAASGALVIVNGNADVDIKAEPGISVVQLP